MSHRIIFSLFRFVIAVCFFGIAASAHAAESKPVAVIEAGTLDFGEVFEGTDVTHDFLIKNTGDADLKIQSVKAG